MKLPKPLKALKGIKAMKNMNEHEKINQVKEMIGNLGEDKKIVAQGVFLDVYKKHTEKFLLKSWLKNFFVHANRVVEGRVLSKDFLYWKNVFPKFLKDSPQISKSNESVKIFREWLDSGFWIRVKLNEVSDDDVEVVRDYLIPYMECAEDKNRTYLLQKLGVLPDE